MNTPKIIKVFPPTTKDYEEVHPPRGAGILRIILDVEEACVVCGKKHSESDQPFLIIATTDASAVYAYCGLECLHKSVVGTVAAFSNSSSPQAVLEPV